MLQLVHHLLHRLLQEPLDFVEASADVISVRQSVAIRATRARRLRNLIRTKSRDGPTRVRI
jgi:hypothetical protein